MYPLRGSYSGGILVWTFLQEYSANQPTRDTYDVMGGNGMRKLDVEKYRTLLLQERARIHGDIEALDDSISYDDTGTGQSELADYDQHPADAGTDTFEKEKDLAVRDNWRGIIGQIDEALGKIDRGTYGICDRCGREISEARLGANPHAIYCVDCQGMIEGR